MKLHFLMLALHLCEGVGELISAIDEAEPLIGSFHFARRGDYWDEA